MDNLGILIQAVLSLKDTTASKNQIAKELPKLESQLQSDDNTKLKIVAGLDMAKSKSLIQSQLATITGQNKISVAVDINNANIQTATTGLKSVESQAKKAAKSIHDINVVAADFNFPAVTTTLFPYDDANESSFTNAVKTLKNARDMFSKLGFNNVDFSWAEKSGVFDTITAKVTDAYGAVQKFKFALSGDTYKYDGSIGDNAGITKLSNSIDTARAKYARLLKDFESNNSAIKSGLTEPLAKFNTVLSGLGKTKSIKDVEIAFESLKQSASEITKYLDTTNSSFNKSTNAINNYKNMGNILKELRTSFDNLNIKPAELKNEINSLENKFKELQSLEQSEKGYTEAWAQNYRKVNLELSRVKDNINAAVKAEQNSQKADKNSSYQTQLKYLNKIEKEHNLILSYKKKMITAGKEELALYENEIKKAESRQNYALNQLNKKGLYDDNAKFRVNTLREELDLQNKINIARTKDKSATANEQSLKSYTNQINAAIRQLNTLQNSATFTKNGSNPQVVQTKADLAQITSSYQKLLLQLQQNPSPTGLKLVESELQRLGSQFTQATSSAKSFETSLKNANGAEQLTKKVNLLITRIEAYRKANKRSEFQYSGRYDNILSSLKSSNVDAFTLNNATKEFQTLRQEINSTNSAGTTLWQTFKEKLAKFTGWMSMTYMVTTLTRAIRGMVSSVIELDTALVDLKKTFTGTDADLKNLYVSANQTAKELGVSTKSIIEQASAWSRLGYSSAEAAETMAKNSAIFATISPGMDINTATDGLVSIMKAFSIEANDVLDGIMSKVNIVGNKFAVNNDDVIQAMTRSSSALAAANNTLEEAIALNVAATEITRDAASAATALKTVSMRIRGYDEETGQLSDDLVGLKGKIADLTKTASNGGRGISLFTDETRQTYKSTYRIIKEISEIWDELSDKNQAELLEALAGKRNGQVVSATIKNFSAAERAVQEMSNANGNAMAEMEIAYESIGYKINYFKESLVGLGQTIFEQDVIKSVVDSGSGIIEFLDMVIEKLGGVPSLLLAINTGLAFKNIGVFGIINNAVMNFGRNVQTTNNALSVSGNLINTYVDRFNNLNAAQDFAGDSWGTFINSAEATNANMADSFRALATQGASARASVQGVYAAILDGNTRGYANVKNIIKTFNGIDPLRQKDFAAAVGQTNTQLGAYLGNLNGTRASMLKYSTQVALATAKTIALRAASMALNMALSTVVSMVASTLINAVSKAINKQKELLESAKESAEAVRQEANELDGLVDKYKQIVDSQKSEIEKTQELNDWKLELIDTYGIEKEKLENLNLERENGIKLLKEETEAAKYWNELDWQQENMTAVEKAKKTFDNKLFNDGAMYVQSISDTETIEDNSISSAIKKLFDDYSEFTSTDSTGVINAGIRLRLNVDTPTEEYEKLKKISAQIYDISQKQDLSQLEVQLYDDVRAAIKAYEKNKDLYDVIVAEAKSEAFTAFYNSKEEIDNFENLGKEEYLAWRDGLLAGVEGDTNFDNQLRKEVLSLVENQFPSYKEYYDNLDKAKAQFVKAMAVNSAADSQLRQNKISFLEGLSDADLAIVAEIPDLFAEGLDKAQAKIDEWKNKNPIGIEVDEKTFDEIKEAYDSLSDSSSSFVKNQKAITDALDEQSAHGQLSADTIQSLTEAGYAQALSIDAETGAVTLNKEAYDEINQAKKTSIYLEAIQMKTDLTEKYKDEQTAIENLTAEMSTANSVRKTAIAAELASLKADMSEATEMTSMLDNLIASLSAPTFNDSKSGSSSSSDEPAVVTSFKKALAEKQHLMEMQQLSEEDYIEWLDGAYKKAYAGLEGYDDDLYKYEEEVFKKRQELIEKSFSDSIDKIEKEIDLLEEAKDKASIDQNDVDNVYNVIDREIELYEMAVAKIEQRIVDLEASGLIGIEDTIKDLQKERNDYLSKILDKQEERTSTAIENEINYWKEMQTQQDEYYDKQNDIYDKQIQALEKQKKALEDKNDEEERAKDLAEKQLELRKAQFALEDARRNRNVLVYNEGGGFSYEADDKTVAEAEQDVQKAREDLQKQIEEERTAQIDKQIEAIKSQQEILEEQKDQDSKYYDTILELLENMDGKDRVQTESNREIWNSVLGSYEGQRAINRVDADKLQNLVDSGLLMLQDGWYSLNNNQPLKQPEIPTVQSITPIELMSKLFHKSEEELKANQKFMDYMNGGMDFSKFMNTDNLLSGINRINTPVSTSSSYVNNTSNTITIEKIDINYSGDNAEDLTNELLNRIGQKIAIKANQFVSNN